MVEADTQCNPPLRASKSTMQNNRLYDALNEVDYLLYNLKTINRQSMRYVLNSDDDENKTNMGNVVNTFSDCIEMYADRIEAAMAKAWKEYFGVKKHEKE